MVLIPRVESPSRLRWHGRGHRFDPCRAHHLPPEPPFYVKPPPSWPCEGRAQGLVINPAISSPDPGRMRCAVARSHALIW